MRELLCLAKRIRSVFVLGMLAVCISLPVMADNLVISLWPKGAPGEKGDIGEEKDTTTPKDKLVAGKRIIRLTNVTNPTITLYRPSKDEKTGAAVIVFPGGGYHILAMDLEGTEVCDWLNSIGVIAVLLKYRVPERQGLPKYAAPLQDAQRALSIVRYHAKEWHIDPARIGVLGFSAGGHLATALSNNYEQRTYEPSDEADRVSCRPDFALVIYPGFLTLEEGGDKLATELSVSAKTPPTFLVQAEDDFAHVENSLFYYVAMKNAKVPAEMHLYSTGGHGYGVRSSEAAITRWPMRAEEWLRFLGVLRPSP